MRLAHRVHTETQTLKTHADESLLAHRDMLIAQLSKFYDGASGVNFSRVVKAHRVDQSSKIIGIWVGTRIFETFRFNHKNTISQYTRK